MGELLNQEEIDELLKQLSLASVKPSIIDIKQEEIDRIPNIEERNKTQIQFDYANDLYVKPLENLLKFYYHQKSMKNVDHGLGDKSILERISRLRKELIKIGFNSTQLMDLVPKNKEEISTIIEAKKRGFSDSKMCNNTTRLSEAKNYLDSLQNSVQQVDETHYKRA